jgi:hypothetical protein
LNKNNDQHKKENKFQEEMDLYTLEEVFVDDTPILFRDDHVCALVQGC